MVLDSSLLPTPVGAAGGAVRDGNTDWREGTFLRRSPRSVLSLRPSVLPALVRRMYRTGDMVRWNAAGHSSSWAALTNK